MSLLSFLKGWFGEAQGTVAQTLFLDPDIYIDLNNVILLTSNGSTQIDHVIVSPFGIFVIEAKNMKGWIFGDEKSRQWTQSVFGKKFKFQNPLRQNYRHTKALADFLGVDHDKIFSVVMFWGECELKTPMPPNVLSRGYTSYIKSKAQVVFSNAEVQEIVGAIRGGMRPKSWATRRQHIDDLKERFSRATTCPKCGSALVLRTAKTGTRVGSQFYGCSKFPNCRYVAQVESHS
jgi:predicted RNA-binding Zn-ribbon protein involved in translation (DUF1610 family)